MTNQPLTKIDFLAHRLRLIRLSHGYSQEDVALELTIRQATISSYENGYTAPDYERLIEFAEFYDVSIAYFFPDWLSNTNSKV